MAQVFRAGELNLAALTNNDVYVLVVIPANTQVQGIETGIVGFVGGASWGPFNVPQRLASPAAVGSIYGSQATAPNDMPTDANIALTLRTPVVIGVRVTDGTDVKALSAFTTAGVGTVTLAGTLHTGDVITITLGGNAVSYTAKASDTTFAILASSVQLALQQNLAFAAIASVQTNGAVLDITSFSASNTTTLTAAVTGTLATITATASGATLSGGGVLIGDLVALYSGTAGNSIKAQFTPGNNTTGATQTWNLLLVMGSLSELFTNLPEATLAAAVLSALQNGQGVARGPSQIARFLLNGGTGTTAPIGSIISLVSGANGDQNLTSSELLGSGAVIPATGMYAFKGSGVQVFGLSGNTDTTTWATQLAFAQQIGAISVLCFPANTATASAIAQKKAAGIDDYDAIVAKDWIQFLDTTNSVLRLVSPLPFILGRIGSLTPEQSPGNKPIDLVIATERTLANQPYGPDECGLLTAAGIQFITNPVPGGNYFALRHGLNSSSNSSINGTEYGRMTNFLAYSLAGGFGEFIDQNQTARDDDPVRAAAKLKLVLFCQGLKTNSMIDDFSVDMSFGTSAVNTPITVQNGFMIAVVRVKYKSVIRFFIVTLVGGKTVNVTVQ